MLTGTIRPLFLLLLCQAAFLASAQKHERIARLDSVPDLSLSLSELHTMDSSFNHLSKKVDSLSRLNLPTSHYQKKLDSISRHLQSKLSLGSVSDSLKRNLNHGLSSISKETLKAKKEIQVQTARLQQKMRRRTNFLDSISRKANLLQGQLNLPGQNLALPDNLLSSPLPSNLPSGSTLGNTLPNVQIPTNTLKTNANLPTTGVQTELNTLGKEISVPQLQQGNQLERELKNAENLPKQELKNMEGMKELNKLENETKEIKVVEKEAGAYQSDVKQLSKGNLDSIRNAKDLEKEAGNLMKVKEITKENNVVLNQKNALQQYQDELKKISNGKGLQEGETLAKHQLVDHFAGQEQKLSAGMAALEKLKRKYRNIPDSRYLPRFVPNEMKGKPFKDRIVPGVSFQGFAGSQKGLDLSPYLLYRLTGKVRLGAGATWRFTAPGSVHIQYGKVFGYRGIAEYRFLGGWYVHAESEWMYFDPTVKKYYQRPVDPPIQNWNWRLNAGILKTYKISRRFSGQTQILYNVMDWRNFPQNKNVALRFGFEYKLNAKKPKFMIVK